MSKCSSPLTRHARRWPAWLGALAVATGIMAVLGAMVTAAAAQADPVGAPVAVGGTAGAPRLATASFGYWMLASSGAVMGFGGTPLFGSATALGAPAVGMATTPDGAGYWVAAANGALDTLGDAAFYGSAADEHLSAPIVGMAATPDGKGYWLVGADGGVFAFGDAGFFGSAGNLHLNRPMVGMAATPDGRGYWLVAADGGVFAFGDASFYGSTGNLRLNRPVVGMDTMPDGRGYWLVGADGGVFAFGDAPFYGSAGNMRLSAPITGISRVPGGGGYWLVGADGGVFTYGDAPYRGSVGGGQRLHPIVGLEMAPGSGSGVTGTAGGVTQGLSLGLNPYSSASLGYDVSWPQCGTGYPGSHQFGIVGVSDGHAFSTNPCLGDEVAWAGPNRSLYMNLNSPSGASSGQGASGPAGACSPAEAACYSYNYGYNAAVGAMAAARSQGVTAERWWLDVETGNYWSPDTAANIRVIQGAADALEAAGEGVGVYSTPYQWGVITGGANLGLPDWVATGMSMSVPGSWCNADHSFDGGAIWMVQYGRGNFDGDYSC